MEFTSAGASLGDGETRAAGHIAGMRRGSWARDQLDLCVSVVATGVVLVLSHTVGLVFGFIAWVLRLDRVVRRGYRWFADRHPAWLWGDIGSLVPERAAVLDVGAGSCLMARAIRDMRQAKVSCVDVEHRLGTDLPVAVFDGVHLPFPDRSFDVVLMSYVLHHAARPADLLRDCARVCRGRVVVVEDLPLFGRRFFEWGHHRTYNCLVRRPDGIRYGEIRLHFDREWRGLFAGAGLRVAGQRIRWSSGSFPMMRAIYELEPIATPLTESSSES
jgi:SAM-dependent methyltransferase